MSTEDFCSPSSIISKIFKKKPSTFQNENEVTFAYSFLRNYRTLIDFGNLQKIYIEAHVHLNSLDTGHDPNEIGIMYAKRYGEPGDIPINFISKKLGGDGYPRNVYPANPYTDLGQSKLHQNTVYDHVKKGGDRFAKLFFGIIFEEEIEGEDENENDDINYGRPKEIVYKFELYENDKLFNDPLEGKIDNKLP